MARLITCLIRTGKPKLVECRNGFLWASTVRGYSCNRSFREAIVFYARIRCQRIETHCLNLPFVLKSCAALKVLSHGEQIHSDVVKLGFVSDVFVQNSLLSMYVKCSRIEAAIQVFDAMPVKNVVSWTAIIAGYCKHGLLEQAQKLFHDMPVRNVVSWNAMIDGLAQFGNMETADRYFNSMPRRNAISWTIMIGGYSKAGNVVSARFLFDKMIEREVVAWTAMISCYVQNGQPGEAIKLFHEMLATDVKVDEVTMLVVISAAAQLGSVGLCVWVENYMSEVGFESDIRVQNAAINMYVQSGSIKKAIDIFSKIPRKDVISYNSMITGYAIHGDADSALSLFSMMIGAKVQPNCITFTGILTACSRGGLVDEGLRYFHFMLKLGYIEPKKEHYACMVDLLGRAGCLDEAHNLILSMPIRPEPSTWGALLGACRIHGNLALAEIVAQRLFEIEPGNPGNYAVLANMYAERKMWDAANRIRGVMKERGVLKESGTSWAEVSNALLI